MNSNEKEPFLIKKYKMETGFRETICTSEQKLNTGLYCPAKMERSVVGYLTL